MVMFPVYTDISNEPRTTTNIPVFPLSILSATVIYQLVIPMKVTSDVKPSIFRIVFSLFICYFLTHFLTFSGSARYAFFFLKLQ